MVPLVLVGAILLLFVNEKPLATSIERDILPDTLEIDGANYVVLPPGHDQATEGSSPLGTNSRRGAI